MAGEELSSLLEPARKREPEALAALYARFYPDILKYMHYRVGAQEAEDLTEEVFLRVARAIGDQDGSFAAWLYAIASNVVALWFRRKPIRNRVQANEAVVERSASGAGNPADIVARRMDLAEALEQLSDDQREFVTYKFIQGFSNDLIGQITGRKPGAIRALQFRALASLRQTLGGEGRGHESTP